MKSRQLLAMLTALALVLVMAFAGIAVADDGGEFGTMTTLISDYSCGVGNPSGNTVGADGHTGTFDPVQYIEVKITIQRWNGSRWQNMSSKTFEKEDSEFVAGITGYEATQSGWYRTRGDHYAQHGWSDDSATCFTTSIWVDVN